MVRVRFAPSPTGPLHIGGVRTALFNFLFARKHGGTFILRIEDTDRQRFVEGAEDYIVDSLNWCGLHIDEGPHVGGPFGPYRQSERKDIYIKYAMQLLEKGHAYYAFDTPAELDAMRQQNANFQYDSSTRVKMQNSLTIPEEQVRKRIDAGEPYVIRIKIPVDRDVIVDDIVRGQVVFHSGLLDDKVIFKSDGLPTYHLANIVDDHLMQITHVIRGEEWLPSAPLHVLLYEFLGWEPPKFAHLPLILKPQGNGKLSKRDGDKMGFPVFPCNWKDSASGEVFQGYREWGYLPEAFVNMLAFLGWNPGTDDEILSMDELVKLFSLEKVQKAGAKFDPEKTRWFNHQYMIRQDLSSYSDYFQTMLTEHGVSATSDYLSAVLEKIRDRMFLLNDFWSNASYFFVEPASYNDEIIQKFKTPDTVFWLRGICDVLQRINIWNVENIEAAMKEYLHINEIPPGKVFNMLRVAFTGTNQGIGIGDIVFLLEKERTIQRINSLMVYLGD